MKKKIESLDQAPEAYRKFYKESESGGYELGVDIPDEFIQAIDSEREKLSEFRTNNREMNQKIKEWETKYTTLENKLGRIDIDKYEKLMQSIEKDEEKKLIEEGKLEEILTKRTERMKAEYQEQLTQKEKFLKEISTEKDNLMTELTRVKIDTRIKDAVNKVGNLRKGAEGDVTRRAREVWSVSPTGEAFAKYPDGTTIYGATGNPLTPEEWAKGLLSDASYLFESAKGAGGTGTADLTPNGKIKVDPSDPVAMGKYHKEIKEGKAEFI